ncbi:hypothetical protein N7486_002882 [Penicillium sp. IBT 16267x]|nr:hypothetical protein N7486_002882 [Penicillium sp. IBT 16267x]
MAGRDILKDGPMACPKSAIQPYAVELKNLRDQCLALLQDHEENTPDTFWSEENDQDPDDPGTDYDMSLLKLATQVVIENGKHHFPPPYTRLSDELVYFATKFLKSTDRGRNYPYDFQPRGDINPDRVPSGVGPIVWAHGLPFFPVYKGYYILCGRKHADWIGWKLHGKHQTTMREYPIWTIGPVVAPGSAVSLERTANRQMRTHKMKSAKECEKGMEKSPVARDVVSAKHFDGSVVPRDSKGGFMITPIYRVQGYSIKVGPNAADGSRAMQMGKQWFSKNRITDFDWEAASKLHYTNERNPMIYGDDEAVEDDDDDEVEDDAEEEEVESGIETDETCFMDETEDSKLKTQDEVNMDGEEEGDMEITKPTMDEIAEEATDTTKSLEAALITETTIETQEKDAPQSHPTETNAGSLFTSQRKDGTPDETAPGHAPQNSENEGKDQGKDQDTDVLVDIGHIGPEPEEAKIDTDAQASAPETVVTGMTSEVVKAKETKIVEYQD